MSAPAMRWICGRDTGLSSRAIWSHMMNGIAATRDYPLDADDFGRCYRLLNLEPSWRGRIDEMAVYGVEWAALVAHWPELESLYTKAVVGSDWDRSQINRAAWGRLCDRMREIESAARICIDCGKPCLTAWSILRDGTVLCPTCADTPRAARATPAGGTD